MKKFNYAMTLLFLWLLSLVCSILAVHQYGITKPQALLIALTGSVLSFLSGFVFAYEEIGDEQRESYNERLKAETHKQQMAINIAVNELNGASFHDAVKRVRAALAKEPDNVLL